MMSSVLDHMLACGGKLARLGYTDSPLASLTRGDLEADLLGSHAGAAREYGTVLFSDQHDRYSKSHKVWVRACTDRDKVLKGENTPQAKKDGAIAAADAAKIPRDADFRELLRAMAAEEVTRCLPGMWAASAQGDEDSAEYLLRWSTGVDKWAWAYFGDE